MKKITDEILNKYIDNELSESEIEELKIILSEDQKSLERLKALKFVDSTMKELKIENAPANITSRIMSRIESISFVKKKNYSFFYWIIGIFSALLIGLFGFMFSFASSETGDSGSKIMNNIISHIPSISIPFNLGINSNSVILIGASLTIILLITFYFLVVSHREIKNSLDSLSR